MVCAVLIKNNDREAITDHKNASTFCGRHGKVLTKKFAVKVYLFLNIPTLWATKTCTGLDEVIIEELCYAQSAHLCHQLTELHDQQIFQMCTNWLVALDHEWICAINGWRDWQGRWRVWGEGGGPYFSPAGGKGSYCSLLSDIIFGISVIYVGTALKISQDIRCRFRKAVILITESGRIWQNLTLFFIELGHVDGESFNKA